MYTGAGQTFFFKVVLILQPFGSAWLEQGVVWSWSMNNPQVLRDPQAHALLELHLQWVLPAGALRNEAFPDCQSSRQHGDTEWAREVGLVLHHSHLQGSLKPHWGGFGAFEGTTNLLVHSTLPQLGIYNPACPERFGFWVTKYSVVLTVSYKSQWCNECPDSLQGVFTGLEQNSWSYRNRSISFLVSTRNF